MMKRKKEKVVQSASSVAAVHRIEHEAEGGALGVIGGAVMGSVAGLPGALAGAVIGGIAGAMAGGAVDSESGDDTARTKKLDAEIGVTEGDIGAPNLDHPPGRAGG
jgi:outer membrane lipoprotein SlyB